MKNNKKAFIIGASISVAVIVVIASFFMGGDKKKNVEAEKWGKVKEEEVLENTIENNIEDEADDQIIADGEEDTGLEEMTDEFGLVYQRRNIPSMNISLMIPKGWEMNLTHPDFIYFSTKNDERYKGVEIALTSTIISEQVIDDLGKNMVPIIKKGLAYHIKHGYPVYISDYMISEEEGMHTPIYDENIPVWIDDSDPTEYIEYLEKPNIPGTVFKEGYKFVAYHDYGVSIFKDREDPLGPQGSMYYELNFTFFDDVEQLSAVIAPRMKDKEATEISRIMRESAQPAEVPDNFSLSPLGKRVTIGDFSLRIPENFYLYKGASGDTGHYGAVDPISPDFGIEIAAYSVKFSRPDTMTRDINAEEYKNGLFRALSRKEEQVVTEIVAINGNELIMSSSVPEDVMTGVKKYEVYFMANTKFSPLILSADMNFPVQGSLYVTEKDTEVLCVFIKHKDANKNIADKIGLSVMRSVK